MSAITAKAKLAGLWREKVDQHSTGTVSTVWQVGWQDDDDGEVEKLDGGFQVLGDANMKIGVGLPPDEQDGH